MKIQQLIKYGAVALAALAVVLTAPRSHAQPTFITGYTNTFDNNGSTGLYTSEQWMYWYSIYPDCFGAGYNINMTNDASMDADGNTNASGSLLCYSPFAPPGTVPTGGTTAEPSYGEQNLMSGVFDPNGGIYSTNVLMNIITVTNISFKIHVLGGTVTDANGNFGTIAVGLKSQDYQADTGFYTNELTIPGAATNGWVLMQETNAQQFQACALAPTGHKVAQGVEFYYTQYNANNYPKSPVTFWIDDITVQSSAAPPPPPPPPTMSISTATPGLNLFGGTGNTSINNREDIEATNANYSWVGASGPVTYSFTINSYPLPAEDQFQTQIFLIPNPGTESAPDYTEPNCIFLDLESTTNGAAAATFRYKTNDPDDNTMIYNTNIFGTSAVLGKITNLAGGDGTWSLTFNNNTNVTMTCPSGSTNFSIPDGQFVVPAGGQTNVPAGTIIPAGSTSALFASGVDLYFGVQGNNGAGNGGHISVANFTVTGLGSADFSDNFIQDAATNGSVNGTIWETNASEPTCVVPVAPGNVLWVDWTQPASGYSLQSTAALGTAPAWQVASSHTSIIAGTNYTQLVSTNDLASPKQDFFTLVQRTFSQLLVLFPGETNAPGTASGKIGTPTPVSLSATAGQVNVTVLAVDSHFYPVSGISDAVKITSSTDPGASLPSTSEGMASGVAVFGSSDPFYFGTQGTWTVTVTDETSTNIATATSSQVTVTQ